MYPSRSASVFSVLSVALVYFDGTTSQIQEPFPSDWAQAAQAELNRELKLQQEMIKQHAADVWAIHRGEPLGPIPGGTTSTSKPQEIETATVTTTTTTSTERVTTQRPPPRLVDYDYNLVDLRICVPTKTQVSERKEDGTWRRREKMCRGDVIFKDEFSKGPRVDGTKWSHEVKMPWSEGYGFVIYQESLRNSYVKDNMLFLKPTILDDRTARNGYRLLENCTGQLYSQECERRAKSYSILPPIETALLTTKNTMSFKYGQIEIRAKLPKGDWILPEMKMEPRNKNTYGRHNSGLIQLALARGNTRLIHDTNDIGNNHLEMGFEIGGNPPRTTSNTNLEGWGSGFHTYRLIWTPDNMKFQVDDKPAEPLCPQGRQLYKALGIRIGEGKEATWNEASNIAPFDKEFYLTLGLSVGGLKYFPDESRSSGQRKPWGDQQAKALYTFWENRGQWLGSWETNNGEDSALVIDYVKITAI